jgi:hypothetical protein
MNKSYDIIIFNKEKIGSKNIFVEGALLLDVMLPTSWPKFTELRFIMIYSRTPVSTISVPTVYRVPKKKLKIKEINGS